MPGPIPQPPSFSPRRRWKIGLELLTRTALVVAVVVMVNYLGAQFFHRFYLSSQTRVALSPRTLSVLHSLTNHIAVTLYYSPDDDAFYPFYSDVTALLDEYSAANPFISVKTVDYVRDSAEAQRIKQQYHLDAATDKTRIIFDAGNGIYKAASGDALIQYTLEAQPLKSPTQRQLEFEKKPVAFHGEEMFTSILLALQRTNPFTAYFLQGDGEPSLAENGDYGYLKFGLALREDYVAVTNLELLGDQPVPANCDLLIIAGPTDPLPPVKLEKIEQYLGQGGRLLALFDIHSFRQPTGLEPILQRWGVNVAYDYVRDPETVSGQDVIVRKFSQHSVVSALAQHALQMDLPRPIFAVVWQNPPPNAPQVSELAFSSAASTLAGHPAEPPRSYPLIAAIEQKPAAGVASPGGNTRIIVAGDSIFLNNHYIEGGEAGVNRDFLNSAVNWLLDRPTLLQGIGPRPVTEFRLLMTQPQRVEVRWLLLAALPSLVLLLGGVVWLVRRK
ncbi:MAG: GldG family protein [Verrucomicrobiota bacterium]|jgi:hypothetical protein